MNTFKIPIQIPGAFNETVPKKNCPTHHTLLVTFFFICGFIVENNFLRLNTGVVVIFKYF